MQALNSVVNRALTKTENVIHGLRESGLTQREIAGKLGRSLRTVQLHCARISFKQGKDKSRTGPQYVYFIQAESGPIKIGVSVDAKHRIKMLQNAHHEKLTVLRMVRTKSPLRLEAKTLELFAKDRIRGEWLKPSPELLEYIQSLKSQD